MRTEYELTLALWMQTADADRVWISFLIRTEGNTFYRGWKMLNADRVLPILDSSAGPVLWINPMHKINDLSYGLCIYSALCITCKINSLISCIGSISESGKLWNLSYLLSRVPFICPPKWSLSLICAIFPLDRNSPL